MNDALESTEDWVFLPVDVIITSMYVSEVSGHVHNAARTPHTRAPVHTLTRACDPVLHFTPRPVQYYHRPMWWRTQGEVTGGVWGPHEGVYMQKSTLNWGSKDINDLKLGLQKWF